MREFNKYICDYFIDDTYKIIPKKHKNYKLMPISGYNKDKMLHIFVF